METTLFCLHYLGGSARSWDRVAGCLGAAMRVVAIDLPGFGDAVDEAGYGKAEMADAVAARIVELAPTRWALAGHSMGGAVATILAQRAEAGDAALAGLAGIVLAAASPPCPEPMDDGKRAQMLGWFASGAIAQGDAQAFVDQNVTRPLAPEINARAVADVMRANPAAWCHWLEFGSREDWSERVGTLQTPALIVAGFDDASLGPDAQRRFTLPHFARATVEAVPGVTHLLPLECPQRLAAVIETFLA